MLGMQAGGYPRIFSALLFLSLALIPATAQDDPDPNSPTPVMVRAPGQKRVLAVSADSGRDNPNSPNTQSFPPGSRVAIFVQNIELMGMSLFRKRCNQFPCFRMHPMQLIPSIGYQRPEQVL